MKKRLNLEKNFISVIIYTKNDHKRLQDFLSKITDLISENFEYFEFIVVDDSGKSTARDFVSKFTANSNTGSSLNLIEMSHSQGVEAAMNAGVDFSIGDFVLEFDSVHIDYPLDTIMTAYKKALENNDVVAASPICHLKLTSRIFYKLFNKYSAIPESLTTESFVILSRRAINRINNMSAKIPYRKAVYANCGLQKTVVAYKISSKNQRSNNRKYRRGIAVDSLILFTDVAYKFAITMSFAMMILLLVTAIYAIIIFASGEAIAGWTTTILLLSFAFFGLFVILTIIIKYLSIIISLIFQKQPYIVKSTDRYML